MVRTQLYLTREQHALLRVRAAAAGRTLSDEVRDAVDARLAEETDAEERRLAGRRAWLNEAKVLGPAWVRDDDEDGAAYVDRIRGYGAAKLAELDRRWHGDEPDNG